MVSLLSGPDFKSGSILSFDIEGTYLTFPVPDEGCENTKAADSRVYSINDTASYDVRDPKYMMVRHLFKTFLNYFDKSDDVEAGSTLLEVNLLKVGDHRPVECENLFDRHSFLEFYFHKMRTDESSLKEGDDTDQYLIFPQSPEEIRAIASNDLIWLHSICGYAAVLRPYRMFVIPITNNHILMVKAQIAGYEFGPLELQRAMEAEADEYLLEFVKSIRIEYSPETQAEIDKVRAAALA